MSEVIEIPYNPRPLWRNIIHPAFDRYRFGVIVAHRRFGKSVGSVNELIKKAIQCPLISPQFAYVAPYQKQARMIAWNYLKYYTGVIKGIKVNESQSFIEFPSRHSGAVGARIYVVGADNPDVLRGTYWDGVDIDEYAQIKPELWGEVIRPALADRKGFAFFIGTPKGQNAFYEMYQRALRDEKWFCFLSRADESGVLDADELESMKRDMTDMEIRQELLCDFTASSSDIVIPIDLVTEAAGRARPDQMRDTPTVLGVDVARFGDDRTVIFKRQGLIAETPRVYSGLSVDAVVDRVVLAIEDYSPDIVFIDVGNMGAGVIDGLRRLGHKNIYEIPFNSAALNSGRYANIRAEMYFKAREWLEAGGVIPNMPELKSELCIVEYKFANNGKIILQPKEKIKEAMGKSPDIADAFVLTFARPVRVKSMQELAKRKRMAEYDPLKMI